MDRQMFESMRVQEALSLDPLRKLAAKIRGKAKLDRIGRGEKVNKIKQAMGMPTGLKYMRLKPKTKDISAATKASDQARKHGRKTPFYR